MQNLTEDEKIAVTAKAMQQAIINGDLNAVLGLIKDGFDLQQSVLTYRDCYSALHMAATQQRVEICKALIDAGADVNARTRTGDTPLMAAVFRGKIDICEVMLGSGADLFVANNDGDTPLHWAVDQQHPDTCRWLLDRGCNPSHPNNESQTPLHYARFNAQISAMLVGYGAQPSYMPKDPASKYLTPFQLAITDGDLATVRHFVEQCGEDIAQTTVAKKRMTTIANKNPQVKSYLLSLKTELAVNAALTTDDADDIPVKAKKSPSMSPL